MIKQAKVDILLLHRTANILYMDVILLANEFNFIAFRCISKMHKNLKGCEPL